MGALNPLHLGLAQGLFSGSRFQYPHVYVFLHLPPIGIRQGVYACALACLPACLFVCLSRGQV